MIEPGRWRRATIVSGLAVVAAYLIVAFRLLPLPAARAVFLLFGPLLAVAVYATGQWLAAERDSVALRLGVLLHVVAAAFVGAMAVVQNTNLALMRARLAATHDAARRELLDAVFAGVDGIQLALDVAWDLWITTGAVFLAVALLRHPRFGPLLGWTGLAAALLVLVLNLWTFPQPPAEAGLFDAGPVLALWYLAVIVAGAARRGVPTVEVV